MKFRIFFNALVLLYLASFNTHAQVLVLVHGHQGQGGSWRESGITHVLDKAGWEDGGHLRIHKDKEVINYRLARMIQDKTFYTLDMPSEAPIAVQAQFLATFLKAISSHHPGESMNLAGFSAGGLVSRMYMVARKSDEPKIAMLVTIATPHLGTHMAEIGAKLQRTPLAWITPYMGAGTFNRSANWLNRQVHPTAKYVSIVRSSSSLLGGDFIVPSFSQNMNNVIALRGNSSVVHSTGGHELTFQDALLLTQLMLIERQI
jgi:pimeloyl-ACP methyl ester carboxylesterase